MSVTNPKKKPRLAPQPYAINVFFVARTFLLAALGVAGAVYALWRYYTHPRGLFAPPSAIVDAGSNASTTPDSGEIPAPEIELTPP